VVPVAALNRISKPLVMTVSVVDSTQLLVSADNAPEVHVSVIKLVKAESTELHVEMVVMPSSKSAPKVRV